MEIKDNTFIVTGGASGLGTASCRRIIQEGGNAVIFDMNEQKGVDVANELGEACVFVCVNVMDEDSVNTGIQTAVRQYGSVQGLISCAGSGDASRTVGRDGPFPLERFQHIVNLNLVGTFNVLRLLADEMQHNTPVSEDGERGVIINVASVAAIDGQIGQAAYSASKAGVAGMTLPIARDLGKRGIRINTICPGVFQTELMSLAPQEMIDGLASHAQFPRRLGRPEEFADLAISLMRSTYMNGETVRLDAGMRMPPR